MSRDVMDKHKLQSRAFALIFLTRINLLARGAIHYFNLKFVRNKQIIKRDLLCGGCCLLREESGSDTRSISR